MVITKLNRTRNCIILLSASR